MVHLTAPLFVTYFANWAQYHVAPYGPYTPSKLLPIVDRLDVINYAFAYFDADTFELTQPEPKDSTFYGEIVAMKALHPKLKVVLSVGGWNFPSAHFSAMVSTAANRAKFIASVKSTLAQYQFDGVDIDWEYPCSAPRTDYVKLSCADVKPSADAGGGANGTAACGADTGGLLALIQELRAALGAGAIITTASQAGVANAALWDLKAMAQSLSWFNVMSYDYTVSDVVGGRATAPNSPLYPPRSAPTISQQSINSTISYYLAQGVPPAQIVVGVALYGHTWFVPPTFDRAAATPGFGANGTVQGQCCGAFKTTYGAKYGKGSQLCGTYMFSEIIAAGFSVTHDTETNSDIGYLSADSADEWTKAGPLKTETYYRSNISCESLVAVKFWRAPLTNKTSVHMTLYDGHVLISHHQVRGPLSQHSRRPTPSRRGRLAKDSAGSWRSIRLWTQSTFQPGPRHTST